MTVEAGDRSVTPRSGYVALLGWTNVGKSTLLNRLVGIKLAAVADVAQTTRHRILGVCNRGGGQLVFVDTPGIHRPKHRMNQTMVDNARRTIRDVDLCALVVDASRGIGAGDREVASLLSKAEAERVLVLNKIDLMRDKTRLLPMIQEGVTELGFADVVPVSALTGDGTEALLDLLLSRLPEGGRCFRTTTSRISRSG